MTSKRQILAPLNELPSSLNGHSQIAWVVVTTIFVLDTVPVSGAFGFTGDIAVTK